MDKEVVITTKECNKFTFKREVAEEVIKNIFVDDNDMVHFGNDVLIVPKSNLNFYWCHDVETK